jgi:hypothetical protein
MARYKLHERNAAFRQCANDLSWTFKEEGDNGMIKWLLDFNLFKQGMSKKIKPLIILDRGDMEFTAVFDYAYTISTGKTSHTFRQTVYFRYSKALALPHFVMVPEKWYHQIGVLFGMQDIDFIEYPIFSKNYLLQGKDEDYIRHHFNHPEMVRFFDRQKHYSLEGVNYLMVLYVHNMVMPQKLISGLSHIGNTLHNYFTEKTPDISLPEAMDFGDPHL